MKKIVIIGLLLIFVLPGCSNGTTSKSTGEQTENNSNESAKNFKNRMPDFERPEEDPSLSGLVTNIIGNEATILKIERQNRRENVQADFDNSNDGEEKKEQTPTATLNAGVGGGPGMGIGGSRPGGERMDMDDDARLEMLKQMSAGEAKIIIPVGIKMLKNEDGKMVEAVLSDVTKDTMIMVWTDATITDRNVATFVIIN